MDEYKPYKPPGFRPTSLSIVTVTPEIQVSLLCIFHNSLIDSLCSEITARFTKLKQLNT